MQVIEFSSWRENVWIKITAIPTDVIYENEISIFKIIDFIDFNIIDNRIPCCLETISGNLYIATMSITDLILFKLIPSLISTEFGKTICDIS